MFLHFALKFSISNEVGVNDWEIFRFFTGQDKIVWYTLWSTLLLTQNFVGLQICREYYTGVKRYEFYVWVAGRISHEWVQWTSKILFLPWKLQFITRSMFYYIDRLMMGFLTISQRFSTSLRRFPKIFQNLSEGHTNVAEHFPKIEG